MYDYLIFIGRFQPVHAGHVSIIRKALEKTRKLILLVGSADAARSPRNPFTYDERKAMMETVLTSNLGDDADRVIIKPLYDYLYNNDAWIGHAQQVVSKAVREDSGKGIFEADIGLAGCAKDNPTSFYLKMFPQWSSVGFAPYKTMNSTAIRSKLLRGDLHEDMMPQTESIIGAIMLQAEFRNVMEWHEYDLNYKELWKDTPFPVQFQCADAVAIQSGHILLVKRKYQPGKGLLALPGGHLNNEETLRDCCVRELLEETGITDFVGQKQGKPMPPGKLSGFIKDSRTFDDPHRSSRGRVITQAFLFQFPATKQLWHVEGMDDAEKEGTTWYELGTLTSDMLFEDHAHIIRELAGYDLAPPIG